MSSLLALLPQHPGILPQWFLFVSILAVGNTIQAYTTLSYTSRVYSENPNNDPIPSKPATPLAPNSTVTPLSARTFGTWTLLATMVRLYAAYNIDNAPVYQMAFGTYLIAALHFGSEWFYYRTVKWGAPLAGPVVVSLGSLAWMWTQWDYYLHQ